MRELREFRAHHAKLSAADLVVAGVAREPVESNRRWAERLKLPYPLLSDPDGEAARALGVVRRIGIGAWGIELFRRSTFLVDVRGAIAAVWGEVKVRGHADQIIARHRALTLPGAAPTAPPVPGTPASGEPAAFG